MFPLEMTHMADFLPTMNLPIPDLKEIVDDSKDYDAMSTAATISRERAQRIVDAIINNEYTDSLRKLNNISKKYKLPFKVSTVDLSSFGKTTDESSPVRSIFNNVKTNISTSEKRKTEPDTKPSVNSSGKTGTDFERLSPSTRSVVTANFALGFPTALEIDSEFRWSAEEIGVIGTELMKANSISTESLLQTGNSLAEKATIRAAMKASEGVFGSDAPVKAFLSKNGVALNPREHVMFNGVTFRQFTLEYKFAPKTQQEALNMMAFIKKMHIDSAPELTGGIYGEDTQGFFTYPSVHAVKIVDRNGATILDFGNCRCTAIRVNLMPNGVWAAFEDGIPVQVDLSISYIQTELPLKSQMEQMFSGFKG